MLFKRHGFTLIELSIVLIVIGLIVGGVLVAADLAKDAQLRKITSQFNQYIAATQTFRLKYGYLPGDFPSATTLWGDAGDCGGSGGTTVQAATCNGNGDGIVGCYSASPCSNWQTAYGGGSSNGFGVFRETFTFWQQLANAGMIEGQYSGAYGGGAQYTGTGFVPGISVADSTYPCRNPRSCLFPNLAFFVLTQISPGGSYGAPRYVFAPYINTISLASIETGPSYFYWMGMIPLDQQKIDTKLDDGIANTGKLVATQQTGNCYNLTTGVYTTTTTTGDCSPNYKNAF